ncbi:Tat pathway signal sequence domain protein [Streptomyces sp. Li-HN-5-11]|uniref:Tat pathway signal sequence domain protein n=1 Tax=Streptomyces sp. Li-HN-5-11 TaxID=3075432 RepID=UPI0028A7AB88|nr:Tat pathway signal sequence domain protein [Streptomyces sp. Li-HN-5-11]WNM34452.1 Tat pathway signal sequence domain protein [Streptomyces sp. Li-HN-5-11]
MSGVGPVEPGEGTRAWDTPEPGGPPPPHPRGVRTPLPRLPLLRERHRRSVLAAAAAALLLAGGGYLYATRPHEPHQPTPPGLPVPSQVVDVTYLDPAPTPHGAAPRSFSLTVLVSVQPGPAVTVTRISQPYSGLSLTSAPAAPFRVPGGSARKTVITMRVTECRKVPENAGLPFLDVTLRNTRAMEVHSFILGARYAQALSEALHGTCDNDSGH